MDHSLTNREKHLICLEKAEKACRSADARKNRIRLDEGHELAVRWSVQKFWTRNRNFDHELTQIVNTAASKDPIWKGHVSDNQWFMQQAIMYGIAAQVERL